jgi:hypothetical protein
MLGSGEPDNPNFPEFVARGTIEAPLQLRLCCTLSWDEAGILAANMV